jgi:hypothetical protein
MMTRRGAASAARGSAAPHWRLLAALALLALPHAHAFRRLGLPDQRVHELPGWRGEQKRRRTAADAPSAAEEAQAPTPQPAAPKVTFLSWAPRIVLVERFLSTDEAAHVIDLARCVLRGAAAPPSVGTTLARPRSAR